MKIRLNAIGCSPCVAKELKIHYLNEYNDSVIAETRETILKPFQTKWKGIDQITSEELCKAILGYQNDDMLNDIGNLCYSIQGVFKNQAL